MNDPREARLLARCAPQPCIRLSRHRPETMKQSFASTARLRGGGPILGTAINTMAVFGSPPPRIVIGSLSAGAETGCLIVLPTRGSGSCCPQRDTCRDFPSRDHAPQGDEEFSRQRHDHGRLRLPGGALSPCIIPLGQGALLLEAQEPPRQLHEAATDSSIARLCQTPLAAFSTAFVGGSCDAGVAGDRSPISEVSRQDLLNQHVRCLDSHSDNARQKSNHCVWTTGRSLLQAT